MKPKKKILVYVATSADGYIARADGSVDWLNRPRTAGDYGMGAPSALSTPYCGAGKRTNNLPARAEADPSARK